jgi:hypothetical protein
MVTLRQQPLPQELRRAEAPQRPSEHVVQLHDTRLQARSARGAADLGIRQIVDDDVRAQQ